MSDFRLPEDRRRLPRREFIGGAAAAALLGVSSAADAAPAARRGGGGDLLAVAFYDGARLVHVERLTGGSDPTLCGQPVRLTIADLAPTQETRGRLHALRVHFPAPDAAAASARPFHAWTDSAPAGVATHTTFMVPVVAGHGLVFAVDHSSDGNKRPTETTIRLSTGNEEGAPKLRTGTYIIAAVPAGRSPETLWRGCRFEPDTTPPLPHQSAPPAGLVTRRTMRDGFQPVDFDYLILTVDAIV